jgi:hypothetical protein
MKDEHKNMLLGYIAGKGKDSFGGEGLIAKLFNIFLAFGVSVSSGLLGGIYLFEVFSLTPARGISFGFLIWIVSFYTYFVIISRFQRLIYIVIFGIPLILSLVWLFFPDISFAIWEFIFQTFPAFFEYWCPRYATTCSEFLVKATAD